MNIISIISIPELGDIPIMYILRVINARPCRIHGTSTSANIRTLLHCWECGRARNN